MSRSPKRPAKSPALGLGRGAAVVEAVMRATFAELALGGYEGLGIDEVAARAGVNKTTVYRRWPTKADLVTAAVVSFAENKTPPMPDTGSLRADLILLGKMSVHFAGTTEGRALMRLYLFRGDSPDLSPRLEEYFAPKRDTAGPKVVFDRAIQRGELERGTDYKFVLQVLAGTLFYRNLLPGSSLDEAFVVDLVDTILHGIGRNGKARRRRR